MAKKKKSGNSTPDSFKSNPFKTLKGFAASVPEEETLEIDSDPGEKIKDEKERSFFEEMEFLGVDPLLDGPEERSVPESIETDAACIPQESKSEEELFIEALGELDVKFSDRLPEEKIQAKPRRLKQLKRGSLSPDASLDLHGLLRHQVAGKIEYFLQNAAYQQWHTLLIVTGRGLHSADGQPVLRDEAEKYLETDGKALIAEWGRAPRQHGGEGALVVFLKKTKPENE